MARRTRFRFPVCLRVVSLQAGRISTDCGLRWHQGQEQRRKWGKDFFFSSVNPLLPRPSLAQFFPCGHESLAISFNENLHDLTPPASLRSARCGLFGNWRPHSEMTVLATISLFGTLFTWHLLCYEEVLCGFLLDGSLVVLLASRCWLPAYT